jgi:hypothetical protein
MGMGRVNMNCWEFKKCGRQEGGIMADVLGVCPAFTESRLNGVHGGTNSGRACWIIAGTFCGGKVQGTFAEKELSCLGCDFYKLVRKEEVAKGTFRLSPDLEEILAA